MKKQGKLTEQIAAAAIMRKRWRRHFCLPRYTPGNWWECDVFEITKSDVFREYEIKLTLHDFLADTLKTKNPNDPAAFKHSRIGTSVGPQRFWYVVPQGLIPIDQVPSWAGLIELCKNGRHRWYEKEIKPAPLLHKEKLPGAIIQHAKGVCYYRMHNMFQRRAAV
jgi:hypothetical protein